jgi:hypothetical protein
VPDTGRGEGNAGLDPTLAGRWAFFSNLPVGFPLPWPRESLPDLYASFNPFSEIGLILLLERSGSVRRMTECRFDPVINPEPEVIYENSTYISYEPGGTAVGVPAGPQYG